MAVSIVETKTGRSSSQQAIEKNISEVDSREQGLLKIQAFNSM